MKSDTPRTDAQVAIENPVGVPGNTALISISFARQLERQLNTATERANAFEAVIKDVAQRVGHRLEGPTPLVAAVAILQEERDAAIKRAEKNEVVAADKARMILDYMRLIDQYKSLNDDLIKSGQEFNEKLSAFLDQK